MANFYVAQQNTFNGDGTTPDAATVDGGVGASNDILLAMTGAPAYGSISFGDIVHVRAYGSDPTSVSDVTLLATITISTKIKVDMAGLIWPGSSGHFVVEINNYAIHLTLNADTSGLAVLATTLGNGSSGLGFLAFGTNTTTDNFYSYSPVSGGHCTFSFLTGATVRNSYFDIGTASSYSPLFNVARGQLIQLESTIIDVTRVAASGVRLLTLGDSYGEILVKTKGVIVAGAENLSYVYNGGVTTIGSDHFLEDVYFYNDLPRQIPESITNKTTVYISGYDGEYGFRREDSRCISTWRKGENYPTLNALLPDGVTGWSIKVLPATIVSLDYPAELASIKKAVNLSADSLLDVSVEIVINESYSSPLDTDWWMDVHYTDATGIPRTESTQGAGDPLVSSLAQWNPLNLGQVPYGPNNYDRFALKATTAHLVKKGTTVCATVYSSRPSAISSDFYFLCPDIIVTEAV